ncbi:MAG: sensor histidine kinase [Ilumatobacteraceae bacterium]
MSERVLQVLAVVALVAATVGAGVILRVVTRRTRTLRRLLLVVTFGSIGIGAVAAVVLAWVMVLDDAGVRAAVGVLLLTAVLATVLVLIASAPLGRDTRRLEQTVRRIEAGDREVRAGLHRADELGQVGRALDELTERLGQLEQERARLDEARLTMFSNIGHDLRTPLSALRAAVEALADGVAPEPERYVRAMQRDIEALSALVEDLFLLARIEGGRLDLVQQQLDLVELAGEAVEALEPTAAAHGVGIDLDASVRAPVVGNTTAISRVIRNLLDNAIHHAPAGSVVRIQVTRDAGGPRVRVVDDGPGFPPEFAPHAFERFARADRSRNRATGGIGLGLAIAHGLVEAHGGRIWIEPPPGGHVAFELPPTARWLTERS